MPIPEVNYRKNIKGKNMTTKQVFVLEKGGEPRLEIVWEQLHKQGTVLLDGQVIGSFPNEKTLYQGMEYDLPDGSMLSFKLVRQFKSTELRVLRDGQPLPGIDSDLRNRLANACTMTYVIAGFNFILGFISVLSGVQPSQQSGIDLGYFLYSLLFVVLSFFIERQSNLALTIAVVVVIVNGCARLISVADKGYGVIGGGIVVMIAILIPMFQGFGAIKALKRRRTKQGAVSV
jgi:hypothetical protein